MKGGGVKYLNMSLIIFIDIMVTFQKRLSVSENMIVHVVYCKERTAGLNPPITTPYIYFVHIIKFEDYTCIS